MSRLINTATACPHRLVHQRVDVRLTDRTVEIFITKHRVAIYRRSNIKGRYTTDPSHMPEAHHKQPEWTPERLISWAQKIGKYCSEAVKTIIESKRHPESLRSDKCPFLSGISVQLEAI